MSNYRVAINGFGRIGRIFLRRALEKNNFDIIAINDLTDVKTLAHLFKYDSVHGRFSGTVEVSGNDLLVNGKLIRVYAEKDPASPSGPGKKWTQKTRLMLLRNPPTGI